MACFICKWGKGRICGEHCGEPNCPDNPDNQTGEGATT
jgi:hypothetical protein